MTAPQKPLLGKIKRVAAASAVAMVFSQVVTLVQTLVLARLLTPAEVGLFAAGTVLMAFLTDVSEGGMRAGLVHRETRLDEAAETVFRATAAAGAVLAVGAVLTAPVIGLVFGDPAAGLVAATSAGVLFLHSLTNVPEALLQRQFSVKRRLIVGPLNSVTFAAVSVGFALAGYGVWSLVIASYAHYLVWVTSLWILCGWRPLRTGFSTELWRELRRYGFPLVAGLVAARVQSIVESVVVGRVLSTAALGHYRYGVRISRVPVSAIIEVTANALFPAFSRLAAEPARLRAKYLQALGAVLVVAVVLSGLMVAVGEPAVVVLLGEPWRGAGVAVVAMAGLGVGKALTSVSEEAIKGCGRTRLLNWLTATELTVGIAALALVIPFGLFGVGLAISITSLAGAVLMLCMARHVVGVTAGQIARIVVPPLIAGTAAVVATWLLEHEVLRSATRGLAGVGTLAVDAAAFGVVYVGVLWLIAPASVKALVSVVRRRKRGRAGR